MIKGPVEPWMVEAVKAGWMPPAAKYGQWTISEDSYFKELAWLETPVAFQKVIGITWGGKQIVCVRAGLLEEVEGKWEHVTDAGLDVFRAWLLAFAFEGERS